MNERINEKSEKITFSLLPESVIKVPNPTVPNCPCPVYKNRIKNIEEKRYQKCLTEFSYKTSE